MAGNMAASVTVGPDLAGVPSGKGWNLAKNIAVAIVVKRLSDRKRGWLGPLTNVADGDFANLKIIFAATTR
jgi:hypothetical protein